METYGLEIPQTTPKHQQTITVHKTFLGHSPRPLRGGQGHMPPASPQVRHWHRAIIHTVIGLI